MSDHSGNRPGPGPQFPDRQQGKRARAQYRDFETPVPTRSQRDDLGSPSSVPEHVRYPDGSDLRPAKVGRGDDVKY